jgi:monoamine oxidase
VCPAVDAAKLRVAITRFDVTPEFGGAWSSARPGHFAARAALARPVGGRLFFAGEGAGSSEWVATLTGAWLSGRAAAKDAIARLRIRGGRAH